MGEQTPKARQWSLNRPSEKPGKHVQKIQLWKPKERIRKETQGTRDQASPLGFAMGPQQGRVSGMTVLKRPGWRSRVLPGHRSRKAKCPHAQDSGLCVRPSRYAPVALCYDFLAVYPLGGHIREHLWAPPRCPDTQ